MFPYYFLDKFYRNYQLSEFAGMFLALKLRQ